MKHKAKPIEIQFAEPVAFTLVPEHGTDGERLAREQQQREADRLKAEAQQTNLHFA
jgi:hypothetical protein